MFKIKRLRLQAFRSFKNENVIDFPDNGLLLIDGSNLSTKESSGTGKTSIFLAIAYALDILPTGFSISNQQSWLTEEPMFVELAIQQANDEYIIFKSKSTSYLAKNGEKIAKGAKATNQAVEALFGITKDILTLMTYKQQKGSSLFLRKTDSEKKKFLSQVLSLDKIEEVVSETVEAIKVKEVEFKQQKQVLDSINLDFDIAKIGDQFAIAVELEALAKQQRVLLNNKQKKELEYKTAIKQIQSDSFSWSKEEELKDVDISVKKVNQEYNEYIKNIEQQKSILQKQIGSQQLLLRDIQAAERALSALNQKAEIARQQKCPECSQSLINNDVLNRLVVQQDELIEKISKKYQIETSIKSIESNLKSFVIEPNNKINDYIAKKNSLLKERETEQKSFDAIKGAKLKKEIDSWEQARSELDKELNVISQNLASKRSLSERLSSEIANYRKIEKLKKQLQPMEEELLKLKELANFWGYKGFLGAIFAEVLKEIEVECNKKLSQLVNVSNVTIEFLYSQTEKKENIIAPTIYINGNQADLNSGLSGGMLTSLEQVVDLSIIEVLQRRTGTSLGWYCIDEGFDGQGDITKESALEILKNYANDRVVMIVDHNSSFKEMFDKTIRIQQDDAESRVL